MLICKKNQDVRKVTEKCFAHNFTNWLGYALGGVLMMGLLWGCAVAPVKKLYIEDLSRSFSEGTIISSKLGKIVTFDELLTDLNNCRITYVGEKHTNAGHHNIQLEIIRAVFKENPNMAVGMEMFDHTYQDVLDLWSGGMLDERTFLRKVHWYANWRYDFSLYRDVLDFIKKNHIRLVGLNIPTYIPPRIREGGIESLREDEKRHLPGEIDSSITAHRDYVQRVFNHHHHLKNRVDFEDFYMVQAVWEDAMAQMVAQNLKDSVMVVLAGNGHIQYKYGIPDRAFKRSGASFRTIYLAQAGSEVELDVADYIWVTD
jgi:uncharacterized iron-regulated protein